MEAVNGGSLGEDKGGPPPPSPLTGCYLLVVVGEPHSGEHKDIILQRVAKGLLSWDATNCLVDLEKELSTITDQGLEGEEARYGERLIQFASENLVTEILIHPAASTLSQCVRNLLSSFTRHRHIIHAGFTFQGNGSWALQDGTFSYSDFCEAFQEIEVQRVIHAYENGISIDLHCSPEGDWIRMPKETFTKACKVRVNPTDVLSTGSSSISNFIKYLAPFLVPTSLENILESSDVVGNIRFSRPTLYVFPGGQGDAALFGINGFNMLLDGGYSRKACFWDFVRHLDRLDAVLMTRLNNSNLCGISSVLKRKRQGAVYPQVGHFFCNIQERKSLPSPDGDKDRDPLIFSILDEGQSIVQDLQYLNLIPQSCYRDTDPIILYHKVGHGTLNMYVLSPEKNSREVREFLQKWNQSDPKLFAGSRGGRDFSFPLQNLVSICALLVWQPANPNDTITRILYPGSTPQKKIFDGLDRLKSLECIKHPLCSEKSLAPVKKSKQEVIEKLSTKDKVIGEKRTENKLIEDAMKNGDMNGDVVREKQVKKTDSLESDKEKKPKRVEEGKKAEKIEDPEKIVENGEKVKPKIKSGDVKPIKKRGDSQHRKKPAPDKKGPPTPKKTVENKTNGDIKEKKASQKPSPSATPAKSTKDANNRRVVENKKTLPKKDATAPKPVPSAEAKPKPERKPISRRPKTIKGPPSPMKKMTNGVQKPDSISKRGKLDKEGTTDSSTVSTPSADQESVLKKDLSKLTPEEIQQLKDKELDELKEEQEAVKEIEAVFRKGEGHDEEAEPGVRKIKEVSIDDNLEVEEYLIIEKEEIEHESLDQEIKEDEMQKLARDSEESEKQRKLSSEEKEIHLQKEQEARELSSQEILSKDDIPEKIIEDAESKKQPASSPDDKGTPTTDKKDLADEEVKEVVESHPEEKVSANVESGATTTAPTLPEDERITLDDIKEDNGQPVEEKHVKEDTKEKEVPIIQLPPQSQQDSHPKIPLNVEIALDKQKHIRDIVKTPDEVADLPVHEEADYHEFHGDGKKNNETDITKEQDKKIGEKKEDNENVDKSKEKVVKVEDQNEVPKVYTNGEKADETVKDTDNLKESTEQKGETDASGAKKGVIEGLLPAPVKDISKDIKTEIKTFLEEEISANAVARQETVNAALIGVSNVVKSLETDKIVPEEGIIKTDETQKFEILEKAELETKEKVEIESNILKETLKESIDDEWVVITKEDEEEIDIVETAQEADASIEEKKQIIKDTSNDDIIVKVDTDVTKTDDLKTDHPTSQQLQTGKPDLEKENKNVEEKVPIEESKMAKKDEPVEESKIAKKDESVEESNIDKEDVVEAAQLQKEDKVTKEKEMECECEVDDHEIHKEDEIQDILEKDTEDIKALIEEADTNNLTDKEVENLNEPIDDPENILKAPTITDEEVKNIKETKQTGEVIEHQIQELQKGVRESEEELNLDRVKRDLSKIEEPLYTDLKQEGEQLAKIDDKLQELKRVVEDLSMESEEFQIEKSTKSPEHAEQVTLPDSSPEDGDHLTFGELDIDKTELGRKSPAEREEDVKKIVVSVAVVLKSEAPLEELQGKLPFTQELRETHITTQDSPILDAKVIINDDIPPIPEEPAAEELNDVTDRRKDLIADAQQLMAASSKVISDIKSKADENVEKVGENAEKAEKPDDKVEVKVESRNIEVNKGKEIIKAEENRDKAEAKDDNTEAKDNKTEVKDIKSEDKAEATGEKTEAKDNKADDKDDKAEAKDNKTEFKDIKTEDKAEAKDDKTEAKDNKAEDKDDKAEAKDNKTEIKDIKTEDKAEAKDDKTEGKDNKAEDKDDKAEAKDNKTEVKDIKTEDKAEAKGDETQAKDNKAKDKDDKAEDKDDKAEDKDDKAEDDDDKAEDKDDDSGTVHRMLVTASSEDGGEEIEICPPGTITFSKSSESSGRSSPEPSQKTPSQKSSIVETLSDTLSTVKQITEKDLDIGKQEENRDLEDEQSVEKPSVLDSIKDAFDSAKEIVKEKIEDLTKGITEAQTKIPERENIVSDTISSAETCVIDAKDEVKAEIKKAKEDLEKTEDIKEITSDVIEKTDENTDEVLKVISSQAEKLSEKSQDVSDTVSVEKGDEKVVKELTSLKTSIGDDLNKLVSDSKDIEKSVKVKETVKKIENVTDKPIKAIEELTDTIHDDQDIDAKTALASKSTDAVDTKIVGEQLKDSLTNIVDNVENKNKDLKDAAVDKAKDVLTDIFDGADAVKESVENKIDDGLQICEEAKGSIKKEIEALEHSGKKEIADLKDQVSTTIGDLVDEGEKLSKEFKDDLSKVDDNIENEMVTTAITKDLEAKSTDLEDDVSKELKQIIDIAENKVITTEEVISEPKSILDRVEECAKKVEETLEKKVHEVKDEISSKIDAAVTESTKVFDNVKDDVAHIGHELEEKSKDNKDVLLGKVDSLETKAEEVQEIIKKAVDEKVQEINVKTSDTKPIIAEETEKVVDKAVRISEEIKDEPKEDQKVAEEVVLETKKEVSEKITCDMSTTALDITDKIEETIGIKAGDTEAKAEKLDRKIADGKDKVADKLVKEESVEKPQTSAHEIEDSLNLANQRLESTKEVIKEIVDSDVKLKDVVSERRESVIENIINTANQSVGVIGNKSEDLKPSDSKSAGENATKAEITQHIPNRRESLIEKAEDILEKSEKAIESVFSAIGDAANSVLQEILPENKTINLKTESVGDDDKILAEDLDKGKHSDTSTVLLESDILDITKGHITKEREQLKDSGETSLQTAAQSLQENLTTDKVAEDMMLSPSVLEMDLTTNDTIESKLKNIEEKVSHTTTITEQKTDQACDLVKESLESLEGKVAGDVKDNVIKVHDSPQKSDDIRDTLKKSMINEAATTETKDDKLANVKSSDTKSTDEISSAKAETEASIHPKKESLAEKAENILEKSEKAIESVFSAIGDAGKSVLNEILPDEKSSASGIKTDEDHVKQEYKHDIESMKEAPPTSGKSSPVISGKDDNLEISPVVSGISTHDKPMDKVSDETKPTQETSDIIKDEPKAMTTGELGTENKKEDTKKVGGEQGFELTKDNTKDSEKISVDEPTGKHGGVLEAAERFIEESEKTVESVFSAIGSAAKSILHDIIPEDKDNKASEQNEKSEDKKDADKEKADKVNKEDLQNEEKYLDDNVKKISDAKPDSGKTKPSESSTSDENKMDKDIVEKIETKTEGQGTSNETPKSVIFEKCKSSDGLKKDVIEEVEKKVDEWNLKELKEDPSKSLAFTERNFNEIESKVVPKQIHALENTLESVSDMTKSLVLEKDEDRTKMEQVESGPSSITIIDSNKLEDTRHFAEDKNEKEKLVNEQQEKKDPEKEHDMFEEISREIETIQNEFKDNTKPEQELKKQDAKIEPVENDMTKSVYVEKSHESHKLEDRVSECSKTDKTGYVHKEEDPSLNAKDSVVLDDPPISSQTEKCEKESMEKTTSEKDSDNLKVEYNERKKLSISDVEISIKTDECPQAASQIFLDNERAILRDNIDAKMYVQPIVSQGDDMAGSSTISQVTADAINDKSSPELEISGKTTPPTVPVSPVAKEIKSPSSKLDSGLSEQTETDDEDLSTKSQLAHSQSDLDELDMKMDPMSMSFYGALPEDHADGEEVPATLLYEITKAKYTSELKQEDEDLQRKKGEVDLMTASFIGQLPSASKSTDSKEDGSKKDAVDAWGKPLSLPAPTYLYEVTKAKFTSSTEDLMTSSFIGDTLPSSSSKDRSQEKAESSADPMTTSVYFSDSGYDPIASWGKPLGLPSPAPPNNDKGTPKKERKLPAYVSAKNKLNDDKKRAESPSKLRAKKSNPVYVDLTYVPHHGNHYYSYVDFFKKIRARYYVFSGLEPSRQVYDALLEAKQTWEDKELEVTIIPTYDTDILGYWVAENEELLSKFKIDLSPSASRCTINLQDHETSCSAYRLEF